MIDRLSTHGVPGLIPEDAPIDETFEPYWRFGMDEAEMDARWRAHIAEHNRAAIARHHEDLEIRAANLVRVAEHLGRHGALVTSAAFDVEYPAIRGVKAWLASSRTLAVVSGPPGTGKTTAGAWWCIERVRAGRSCPKRITAAELSKLSRYDDTHRGIVRAQALVIDDLGAEYDDARGMFRSDIDQIVDTFYQGERELLITTNLEADEIEARYGDRITDRLAEAGAWIPVTGKSLRRAGR